MHSDWEQVQKELTAEPGSAENAKSAQSCRQAGWMERPFGLREELRGHEDDVRGVLAADSGNTLVTTSYDGTVRCWRASGAHAYDQTAVLTGHEGFVAPMALLPSGELATGGSDKAIRLWGRISSPSGTERACLTGHELQITALAVLNSGDLLSASQDKAIRVWDPQSDFSCKNVLSGGGSSVLCLLPLSDGGFLSGGADKLIHRWDSALQQIGSYSGHGDSVRSLATFQDVGFLSASHDLTARLWAFSGEVLTEFKGHSALVYTARTLPSGSILTASEDCTAKVWSTEGECLHTLTHPKCVWHAEPLPSNDFVTACGDNVGRVWTQSEERVDPTGVSKSNLDEALQKKKQEGESTPSDVPMEDSSVLQRPGKKDGETKVVREGDKGIAYSWNAAQGEWEQMGEVVGKKGGLDTSTNTVDGIEYDYVFDVQLEQSGPYLKLPYNKGDNPYETADRWCEQHSLPADVYRNQIVQFLLQNTEQTGPAIGSVNTDPLTGSGSYQPPASNESGVATANGSTERQMAFVPMREAVLFEDGKIDTIRSKLKEFSKLAGKPMPSLNEVADAINESAGGAAKATLPESTNQLFDQLLAMPTEKLFPALDFARLLLLHESVAQHAASVFHGIEDALVRASSEGSNANLVAGLRLLANCFKHSALASSVRSKRGQLVTSFLEKAERGSKAVRTAIATVLLNLSVGCDKETAEQVLIGAGQVVRASSANGDAEEEAVARCMAAAGTAVKAHKQVAKALASDLRLLELAQQWTNGKGKAAAAAADVVQLLASS